MTKMDAAMKEIPDKHANTWDLPRVYQIRVKGHLSEEWSKWFGGMSVSREKNGDSILHGRIVDQAELHALLRKVRDLGMPLISVEEDQPSTKG